MDISGGRAGLSDPYGPCCRRALSQQHGFRWQPSPQSSAWPLVVTRATGSHTDPVRSKTTDTDMSLSGSTGLDTHISLVLTTVQSPVPHFPFSPMP